MHATLFIRIVVQLELVKLHIHAGTIMQLVIKTKS